MDSTSSEIDRCLVIYSYFCCSVSLFDAYLSDAEKVQQLCGLTRMGKQQIDTSVDGDCSLCGTEMNADNSIDLGCGHRFCKVNEAAAAARS